jgi:hypothetical protein
MSVNSNYISNMSSVRTNETNSYNNYPELFAENIANSAEFAEEHRYYAQPIFAILDKINEKEAIYIASPTINNLMDLFEVLDMYKNVIETSDNYSVQETFAIIEQLYNRLINNIARSTNTNVSRKTTQFSIIITNIYNKVQRKLGLIGGNKNRKKHSKKTKKNFFRKKNSKNLKRQRKYSTRKH